MGPFSGDEKDLRTLIEESLRRRNTGTGTGTSMSIPEVVMGATSAAFPGTGSTNDTVYVAEDTGIIYRWSGTAYVAIGGVAQVTADTRYVKSLVSTDPAQSGGFNLNVGTARAKLSGTGSNAVFWLESQSFNPAMYFTDSANTTVFYSYSANGAGGTAFVTGDFGAWSTAGGIVWGIINGQAIRQTATGTQVTGTLTVGKGAQVPLASSVAEFSSITKGMLPPRMTTVQMNAIASPDEGLMVYDLTAHKLMCFDGTIWQAAW